MPSTPPLALGVGAPVRPPSLASPQLSLARAATLTHTLSSRSPAQSAERMQVIIQQSDGHVPVNPVATPFQSDLSLENRELEKLPQSRWLETAGLTSKPNAQEEQPLHHTEATWFHQSNPDALWHPLRPATSFKDAFATLRSWQSTFFTALHSLQARPDPLDLLCSILSLFDALALSDSDFFLQISSLTRFSRVCVDHTIENLLAFIAGLDAELALKATQEKETRSRKEQSRGTRQRGEENRAPKEESKSNRQGDQEEDSKDTQEDLRIPQLQLRSESPKPKRDRSQERRGTPHRSQTLPFSRGAESVGRSRRTGAQNSKKSVQGRKSSPRSTATCAKPSLKEGSGKGGQGSPHSLPILKNSSPVETDKSTQPTGKKLTTAEGWMDPCAVPDEESGEGTVVTIYPSLPQSSFLGSGEQTLVAQQHGEDLESQDLRFACNTSCTPTIHMSTPTQKPLLDTGASHCLLPYSTLSKAKRREGKKDSSSSRFREACPGSHVPRCHLHQQRGKEFAQCRSVAGFSRLAFYLGGHPSCSSIPFF